MNGEKKHVTCNAPPEGGDVQVLSWYVSLENAYIPYIILAYTDGRFYGIKRLGDSGVV